MKKKSLKLRARIIEVFGSLALFAEAFGFKDASALTSRLNGRVAWKLPEVVKACELLDIEMADAKLYFLP